MLHPKLKKQHLKSITMAARSGYVMYNDMYLRHPFNRRSLGKGVDQVMSDVSLKAVSFSSCMYQIDYNATHTELYCFTKAVIFYTLVLKLCKVLQ